MTCTATLPFPVNPHLELENAVSPAFPLGDSPTTLTLDFDTNNDAIKGVISAGGDLFVGFVSQANNVVYEKVNLISASNSTLLAPTGTVNVPAGLHGNVFAALSSQTPEAVLTLSQNTLAGPQPLFLD